MPGRQRPALSGRRREAPGWLLLPSLTLHLMLLLALMAKPPMAPVVAVSEPITLELVTESGPAARADPAPPAQPSEPPAVEPAPAPDVPPPPIPPVEAPAPAPASAPDMLAAPSPEQAEPAPPTPAPSPPPVRPADLPSPSPPVPPRPPSAAPAPQPRPARPPPARMATRPTPPRASGNPAEPTASTAEGQNAPSRASLASNGAAWMGKLKQWWDQNSFYPREASQTNEGGSVRVRIAIAADGQVTAINVVQGSGSAVLDAAAVAVFRGARLPPFPPGTPPQPADVVITLHYRPGENSR